MENLYNPHTHTHTHTRRSTNGRKSKFIMIIIIITISHKSPLIIVCMLLKRPGIRYLSQVFSIYLFFPARTGTIARLLFSPQMDRARSSFNRNSVQMCSSLEPLHLHQSTGLFVLIWYGQKIRAFPDFLNNGTQTDTHGSILPGAVVAISLSSTSC